MTEMTFLNSALLAGLAAVALPILIHLFSRRRYPLIDFSSLRFLKKLQRQQMRRLKLRQLLLLLLRTLAILLIVLGFARPSLKGLSGFSALTAGRIGMVIVIDASASMQSKGLKGSSFDEAKTAARTLISMMNPGDRAAVVLAKGQPEMLTPSPSEDGEVLLRPLESATPWDGTSDISTAITSGIQALAAAQDFRSELYVISDFAGQIDLPRPPEAIFPFFVQIPPESSENLSLREVRVLSEIIEPGQPVEIEVTLHNAGSRDRQDVYYSIFLNGKRVGEDVISLAAGGEIKRRHQILPEKTGLQQGMVQIEEGDVLAVDNRAYFCFAIPERLNVLLVGDDSATRALRLALSSDPSEKNLINLQQASFASWDVQQISNFDILIFSDPASFSPPQSSRLAHFVKKGGGLLIFPGSNMDVAGVNRNLLDKLDLPKWGEKIGRAGGNESYLGWREPDLSSPLFRGIFRPESRPSTPRFYQALHLMGSADYVPIYFSNGMPLLTENRVGKGTIILCSSSPQLEWSDWTQRGIFAPLVHRLVLRLAGSSSEYCQSLIVGDDLEVSAAAAEGAVASLNYPDGHKVSLPKKVIGQKTSFVQTALNPAGIYSLEARQKTHLAAVNVPEQESNLKAVNLKETYPDWFESGARQIAPDHLTEVVSSYRYGRELWKIALVVGLVLLFVESGLGAYWRRGVLPTESDKTKKP